jgi:hypothetical protein
MTVGGEPRSPRRGYKTEGNSDQTRLPSPLYPLACVQNEVDGPAWGPWPC